MQDPVNLIDIDGKILLNVIGAVGNGLATALTSDSTGTELGVEILISAAVGAFAPASAFAKGAAALTGNVAKQALDPCSGGFNGPEALTAAVLGSLGLKGKIAPPNPKGNAATQVAAQVGAQGVSSAVNGTIATSVGNATSAP